MPSESKKGITITRGHIPTICENILSPFLAIFTYPLYSFPVPSFPFQNIESQLFGLFANHIVNLYHAFITTIRMLMHIRDGFRAGQRLYLHL